MAWFLTGEQHLAMRVITLSIPFTIMVLPEEVRLVFFFLDCSFASAIFEDSGVELTESLS
jgi:hypothetical protein